MPRRTSGDPHAFDPSLDDPADDPDYDPGPEASTPELSIPDVFLPKSAPSTGVTRRNVQVVFRYHFGSDKNAGPLTNQTVEITLGEEGPMDYAVQRATAQVLSNDAVAIVADSLGLDTFDANGWLRIKAPAHAANPPQPMVQPQVTFGHAAPQPTGQIMQFPQPAPAPSGGGGGRPTPNYAPEVKAAMIQAYAQYPHLFTAGQFNDPVKGVKRSILPSAEVFQMMGLPVPAEIKKIWL